MLQKNKTIQIAKALLLLVAFTFNSCSKLDQSVLQKISSEKTSSASALPTLGGHRGIYVNSFSGILGDALKEDSLLNWCVKESFNEVTLYNIGTILNTVVDKVKLNAFVGKAHTWPTPIKVSFITSSVTTVNKIENYINSYANDPDGIASEYEFWNAPYNYVNMQNIMFSMSNLKSLVAPSIKRQLYISRFEDAAGVIDSFTITQQCIQNHEEIFLVNYAATASTFLPNTTKRKLQLIANQAATIGIKARVVILFNCNTASSDPDLWSYFTTHHFHEALSAFMTEYTAWPMSNKSYIEIAGYQIYRYSNARLARPL